MPKQNKETYDLISSHQSVEKVIKTGFANKNAKKP